MKFLQCAECKLIFPFGDWIFDPQTSEHLKEHKSCHLVNFESTAEQEEQYLKLRKQWIQEQKDECEKRMIIALDAYKEALEESRQLERRFPTERHSLW